MMRDNGTTGTLYGVGVGPGDPELMTLQAVRLIKAHEVMALPVRHEAHDRAELQHSAAYRIAVQAVPELAEKTLLPLLLPMSKDPEVLTASRRRAAEEIAGCLDAGKSVIFLTLGDPTIYSTFGYLERIVKELGYRTRYVSGVTSFCAAAAAAGVPLAERDEALHILPGMYLSCDMPYGDGTRVLMKSGGRLAEIKAGYGQDGALLFAVENCGMPGEHIYSGADEIPDESGYFTVVIAKGGNRQ